MPQPPISITCAGANCYLVDCLGGKLLIDCPWPHCLPEIKSAFKDHGLSFAQVRLIHWTHAHPDHAGLAQTLKRLCGARFLAHERQLPAMRELNAFFENKRDPLFDPILIEPGDIILRGDGRDALAALGLSGALLSTPGHSDDSFTLALDDGAAFTGDLTPPELAVGPAAAARASWRAVLAAGARTLYPGHGAPLDAGELGWMLDVLDAESE